MLCCKFPLGSIHKKKKGKEREKRGAYVRLSLVFHPSEIVGKEQSWSSALCPVQGSGFQQRETLGANGKMEINVRGDPTTPVQAGAGLGLGKAAGLCWI